MTIGGFRYLRKNRQPQTLTKAASRDEAVERLRRRVDEHTKKIADAFEQAVQEIQGSIPTEQLANAINRGDFEDALNLASGQLSEEAFEPLRAAITAAAVEGGGTVIQNIAPKDGDPPIIGANGQAVNFVFDATNPELSDFAQEVSAKRVREVSDDVRQVVRNVVQEETVEGTNPFDSARRVRESVGLTATQEDSVKRYRELLEQAAEGDDDAIRQAQSRQLRDRRFKIKPGMSREQIDKQVERYRQRFVKYRSETIARTESTRAINGASHKLMQSYVAQGKIREEQVRRKWIFTKDEKTRADHRRIPAMNPNGVGLNEPFQAPGATLMFPGDPSAPPDLTINCRCTVFDRIVSAELIEDEAS